MDTFQILRCHRVSPFLTSLNHGHFLKKCGIKMVALGYGHVPVVESVFRTLKALGFITSSKKISK